MLVEGQASAELLRQTLVPLHAGAARAGRRQPAVCAEPGPGDAVPRRASGCASCPTRSPSATRRRCKQFDGRPVAGAYVVDDEGVPAKDVTLVEKGRLVTLLTSRTPQKNLLQSNGHGRNGSVQRRRVPGAQHAGDPGRRELKAKYLELLKVQDKPFGYIVRAIAGPGEVAGGQAAGRSFSMS